MDFCPGFKGPLSVPAGFTFESFSKYTYSTILSSIFKVIKLPEGVIYLKIFYLIFNLILSFLLCEGGR